MKWRKMIDIESTIDAVCISNPESLSEGMGVIAEKLKSESCFKDVLEPLKAATTADEANALLVEVYNIADRERIWLGAV